MRFIWATRGRTWGFRFLRDGGFTDPLPAYLEVFEGLETQQQLASRSPGRTALRFEDPLRRLDRAGRAIPHDFVLFGSLAAQVDSIEAGLKFVWPEVSAEYDLIYERPNPGNDGH